MIKEFIFTLGLPGCGKTTYLQEHYNNVFSFADWHNYVTMNQGAEDGSLQFGKYCQNLLGSYDFGNKKQNVIQIAADELKPFINGYSDEHPEHVHEDSVDLARNLIHNLASQNSFNGDVVMDGGAINNHYTSDIIKFIKENCPDVKITCIFFDTPINVCIERVNKRQRKVPVDNIYEKNMKITACVNKYKKVVNEFIRVDYYTNKYLLLDMDGTIAAYSKVKRDDKGNADFINGELFRHLTPVQWVIDFVKQHYDMKNVFIVTACPNIFAWQEKNEWLDEHFPEIPAENRFFCGNKDYKDVFVKHLAIKKKWKINDVVLVDDYHKTIEDCTRQNINCLHPSNIFALADKYAIFSK